MIPAQEIMTFHPLPPVLNAISPASGTTAGGTLITLTGRGFRYANLIVFGGTNVTTFTVVDDTTITFNSPAHVAGIINATVRNPAGTSPPGGVYTYTTPVTPAVTRYQTPGAIGFVVPAYNTLTIECWGGGASGAETSLAGNGTATTMASLGITAAGGIKAGTVANAPQAGPGGSASGGNNTNAPGNAGGDPSPFNSNGGTTGRGGGAPNGGAGGAQVVCPFGTTANGNNGAAPGGGGSGKVVFTPSGGGAMLKYAGGGSGGYVQHVFTAGDPGAPAVGSTLNGIVGSRGVSTPFMSIKCGDGANGEIRFTVA